MHVITFTASSLPFSGRFLPYIYTHDLLLTLTHPSTQLHFTVSYPSPPPSSLILPARHHFYLIATFFSRFSLVVYSPTHFVCSYPTSYLRLTTYCHPSTSPFRNFSCTSLLSLHHFVHLSPFSGSFFFPTHIACSYPNPYLHLINLYLPSTSPFPNFSCYFSFLPLPSWLVHCYFTLL